MTNEVQVARELSLALQALGDGGDEALARLEAFYDADVVFRDPLQTIVGRTPFVAMNRSVIARAKHVTFEVTESAVGDGVIFLAWIMRYVTHMGPTLVFEGSTRARVRDGRIVEQREYWDLLSTFASSVPGIRTLYAWFARKLA